MKNFKKSMDKRWVANTVTGILIVIAFLLLSNFNGFLAVVQTVFKFIDPLIGGAVIAYLMNTLAMLFSKTIFKAVKKEGLRWTLAVMVTVVLVIILAALLMLMLIPQLFVSGKTFVSNLSNYSNHVQTWLEKTGLYQLVQKWAKLDNLSSLSDQLTEKVVAWVKDNADSILSSSMAAGKGVMNFLIAFVLSVYFLAAKKRVLAAIWKLLRVLIPTARQDALRNMAARSNVILYRYVVFNILDSVIVGIVNALLMLCFRMKYIGLVSVIVAFTNLIPTFGPIIGAVMGGFVLLMVNPLHALIFLIFTVVLQLLDGYVLKPRLFGDSLGVSGLLIIVAVIIGGRIAGMVGILLSIPVIAILDFLYMDYLLPWLEKRRIKKDAETAGKLKKEDKLSPDPVTQVSVKETKEND